MIEVCKNLFVGTEADYFNIKNQSEWFVIHACKNFHNQNLGIYPLNKAIPNNHSERSFAIRGNKISLNLIDGDNYENIPQIYKDEINLIMNKAIDFINENIKTSKILVHCNQGISRSPTIAFLYLSKYTDIFNNLSLNDAILEFKKLYPFYIPKNGMIEYVKSNYNL
ncbi:dual specificity protein phosphatase family protein [Candidatus Deianiraea vastatrix]|uniref:Catalytic domain dual specificity phosphatase n=1 Tax=Candidatus Deianiraea vastatrix TaxID=2163644 RepID=A0A5B8XCG2_9RICK|nr:dual specificity protein phosphatase [Candidatus Deianiraea vastatrix]QED23003.1 Putative catalytic domain dual specificity phosphatase [Candidatus Deianiraea vastatrix]